MDIELNKIISLIKTENLNNKNVNYTFVNNIIMNDYQNLHLKLIELLGDNSSIHEMEIDIYNKNVFSIIYNQKYYIIIPDIEEYGDDYNQKLFIVVSYNSLQEYNNAIIQYYSQFN